MNDSVKATRPRTDERRAVMNQPSQPARFPLDRAEQPFAFLWRGRVWILAASLLGAALGSAYALNRGTVWRAQSVIFVSRTGPLDLDPGAAAAQVLPRNYANTQAELLRSTPVLNAALDRPGIQGNPVFEEAGNELTWLKSRLDVGVGNQDDLITVTLDSPLRDEACDVVNAVVDSYREIRAGNERGTAAVVVERLSGELERSEADVLAQQAKLIEFMKANPGVRLHADTDVAANRLLQLHSALTQAEIDAVQAQATWRSAAQLANDPELLRQIPISDSGDTLLSPRGESGDAMQLRDLRALRLQVLTQSMAETSSHYRELQARRTALLTQLSPQHPAVAEIDRDMELLRARAATDDPTAGIQRTIDELEQQASVGEAEFAAAFVAALERRYQSAVERQEGLKREIAAQEQQLIELEPKHAECRLLETRLERARKFSDMLYERIAQIDVDDGPNDPRVAGTDSLIFEYATPEGAIVASSKSAVVAISIFLGAIVGAIIVWLKSQIDQRLRTADDVTPLLPVLATIPRIEPNREGAIATWNANPDFAESLRSLRMALAFGAHRSKSRTFQVGSAEPDDGKSLLTAGLGIALAQAGQRTLIIDADFRRPAQAKLFGISGDEGLSQFLEQGGPMVRPVETEVKGLHVLPSGPLPAHLDELLGDPVRGHAQGARAAVRLHRDRLSAAAHEHGRAGHRGVLRRDADRHPLRQDDRQARPGRPGTIVAVGGRVSGAVLNRVNRESLLGSPGRYAYGASRARRPRSRGAERMTRACRFLIASVGLAAACSSPTYLLEGDDLAHFLAAGPVLPELDRDALLQEIKPAGPYRAAPGDLLEVHAPAALFASNAPPGTTDGTQLTRVDVQGRCQLPLGVSVEAGGRTLMEIEEQVTAAVYPKFLVDRPAIVVRVLEYSRVPVTVLGAVEAPGIRELRSDQMTLYGALSEAGGISKSTALVVGARMIKIHRPGVADSEPIILPVKGLNIPFSDVALRRRARRSRSSASSPTRFRSWAWS